LLQAGGLLYSVLSKDGEEYPLACKREGSPPSGRLPSVVRGRSPLSESESDAVRERRRRAEGMRP
jgi:hypothetical protein